MALGMKEWIEKILEPLKNDGVTTIVLDGMRGAWKTWTAREISMKRDLIHDILWVYLNKQYDSSSLLKNIAGQLSLISIPEEYDDDDVKVEEENMRLELKQRIAIKLKGLISAAHKEDKYFLLILDDVPYERSVKDIISELKTLPGLNDMSSFKVLITRDDGDKKRNAEEKRTTEEEHGAIQTIHTNVDQLSTEESKLLLKENIKKVFSDSPGFEMLSKVIVEMRKSMPSEIIAMAKAFNSVEHIGSGVWSLESVSEAAADDERAAINLLHRAWYDTLPSGVLADCFWHSMQFFSNNVCLHYKELITHWIMEGYVGCIDHIEKAYEQGHCILMELIDRGMLRRQENNIMGGIFSSIADHRRRGFTGTASLGLVNVFANSKWEGLGRLTHTDGMIKSPCSAKTWGKVSTLVMDGRCLSREVPEKYFQPMQELRILTVLNPRFRSLPLSLTSLKNLSILVLRCCDLLEKIDHLREFKNLNVLEISGATCLEKIDDDLFTDMPHLRSLNLSGANIKSLPGSLFQKTELRWLILRGCSQLTELPSLKSFENLQVLDLHGATSFKKFQDKTFAPLQKLQLIDLSNSQISRLPFLHNLGDLTRLLLAGCRSLKRLPILNTLTQLQILDLSGATSLQEIQKEPLDGLKVLDLSQTQISCLPSSVSNLSDLVLRDCSHLVKLPPIGATKELEQLDLSGSRNLAEIEDKSLQHMRFLRVLNFSKAKVKELPSLSNLVNLRQLLLMDCTVLEKLPAMEGLLRLQVLNLSGCVALVDLPHLNALEKLEILDVSGCTALKGIHEKSFENMSCIRTLNLSDSKIEFLPSLPKARIFCHLILRNCSNLKKLPPLEHLSKLEELDLCGAISLVDFEAGFLEHMDDLRILNLTGIPLTMLPSMSRLTNLRQLALKGCSSMETVQNLEALTLLEILDLSGTAIGSLPPLNTFSNLVQLLLKDCSRIEELLLLGSLSRLEVLDLSGTRMKKFPYEISELTNLKHLYLPDVRSMHDLDVGKIKRIPQEVNWDQCGIFEHADIFCDNDKPSISVSGTEIFQFLDKNPKVWETKFKKFCFFVTKKQGEDGDIIFCKDEIVKDVYSSTRHLCFPEEHDRSLEIHGSYGLPHGFPHGFKSVLKHSDCISLVDNDIISCLSDLGADVVEVMKGCWIERCSKIESILCGEEANVRLGRSLEILWVSNLPKLRSLYNGNAEPECFKNLKQLFLDCCPMIVNVFPSSQLPENLGILHVQFCDRLQTLVECDTPSKYTFKKLRTLYLLELPKLTSIGIELPDQVDVEAMECPKFTKDPPAMVD
ncbi:hypothetical protein ACFX13_014428 [Malus domestica]|uniref:Uncharacterized protein n=1 Tax=Malus domestica TaxID=3750 RepID=A0A498I512_MALDO|nr:hypothetical protein DVH24_019439 [Malus domestica]